MKRSKATTTAEPVSSATSPELQIVVPDSPLKHPSTEPAPSSSSLAEHKETYVNMMYNPTASCSQIDETSLTPSATIESPIDDEDDVEMVKTQTKKKSRGPFRLKQLSLMKSGSYKLKHISPPPEHLKEQSPTRDEKLTAPSMLVRQKSTNSSSRSRLKKLFMLSQSNPSRKRQKDISLKNLRHVL